MSPRHRDERAKRLGDNDASVTRNFRADVIPEDDGLAVDVFSKAVREREAVDYRDASTPALAMLRTGILVASAVGGHRWPRSGAPGVLYRRPRDADLLPELDPTNAKRCRAVTMCERPDDRAATEPQARQHR